MHVGMNSNYSAMMYIIDWNLNNLFKDQLQLNINSTLIQQRSAHIFILIVWKIITTLVVFECSAAQDETERGGSH